MQYLPILFRQLKTYSSSSIQHSHHVMSLVKRKENDESRLMKYCSLLLLFLLILPLNRISLL